MVQRSPEQEAFRALVQAQPTQSIILEAVAGSGKTWTLIDTLPVLTGSTVLMAFNKKMAVELETRVATLPVPVRLNTAVGTCHSLAFAAWRKAGYKSRVQGGKLSFLLEDMYEEKRVPLDKEHPLRRGKYLIRQMADYAKNLGMGLSSTAEFFPSILDEGAWEKMIDHFNLESDLDGASLTWAEAIRWAQQLLAKSNDCIRMIDFSDMIYLPLLQGLPLQTYQNVLVDEAQDTNATRREFAIRSLRPAGRLIAVGDPHQAIYGFTGADSRALQNIAKRVDAVNLPLSVCWRCDEKIIDHARQVVSHIRSHDTEGKGVVRTLPFDQKFMDELTEGDVVLCRLNKPNISLAIGLLRQGRKARIEGRDLGERLLAHAKKANPEKPSLGELQLSLGNYRHYQVDLLLRYEKEAEASMLEDELEALDVLIDRCLEQGKGTYFDLEALCTELFVDEGHKQQCILLSSVHKSKGLEFPRVYLLGRDDYMPFWRATLPHELEQEYNLIYVAITRAAHEFVEVTGVKDALEAGVHRQGQRAPTQPPSGVTVSRIEAPNFLHQSISAGPVSEAAQDAFDRDIENLLSGMLDDDEEPS